MGSNAVTAFVNVNQSGMSLIRGGTAYASEWSNEVDYAGFYFSNISDDGKTLTIGRIGWANYNAAWGSAVNVCEIIGIK